MDLGVVPLAQEGEIAQVGGAAGSPVGDVVSAGPSGWDRATRESAATVAEPQGGALPSGHEPAAAAELEHLTIAPEDRRDDLGVARQPSDRLRCQDIPVDGDAGTATRAGVPGGQRGR